MKRIEKDELYGNLSGFLNTKGIELKEGAYSKRIQQGCSILADLINIGQDGIEKAKTSADEGLDRLRQVIHEKTAPKGAKSPKAETAPGPEAPKAEAKASEPETPRRTKKKTVKRKPAKKG